MAKRKKKPLYTQYGWNKSSVVVGQKPDGKPDRKYFYYKTDDERKEKRAALLRGVGVNIDTENITVAQWSQRWLDVYKKNASDNMKPHYKAKVNNDIVPYIGTMRMRDVKRSDLVNIMGNYNNCAKSTVDKIKQAIQQLFSDAIKDGIIDSNPASDLELPHTTVKPRRALFDIERAAVLEAAKKHKRGAWVLTSMYTGERKAETVALIRSDIDLEAKTINITKAWDYKKLYLKGTKSANMKRARSKTTVITKGNEIFGARTVPIPDPLLPVLAEHCKGLAPNDLLFPKTDGDYATASAVRWWWKSFMRTVHIEAGAKLYNNAVLLDTSPVDDDITPHYLRHTYSTDMTDAGIDVFVRKALMGHSTTDDVTDGYTTLTKIQIERARKALNRHYKLVDGVKNGVKEKE